MKKLILLFVLMYSNGSNCFQWNYTSNEKNTNCQDGCRLFFQAPAAFNQYREYRNGPFVRSCGCNLLNGRYFEIRSDEATPSTCDEICKKNINVTGRFESHGVTTCRCQIGS